MSRLTLKWVWVELYGSNGSDGRQWDGLECILMCVVSSFGTKCGFVVRCNIRCIICEVCELPHTLGVLCHCGFNITTRLRQLKALGGDSSLSMNVFVRNSLGFPTLSSCKDDLAKFEEFWLFSRWGVLESLTCKKVLNKYIIYCIAKRPHLKGTYWCIMKQVASNLLNLRD